MATISKYPTSPKDTNHVIGTRLLANTYRGCSHFPPKFWCSYIYNECLIHYQTEDSLAY